MAGIKIFLAGIKIFSAGIVIILAGIEIFSAVIKFFFRLELNYFRLELNYFRLELNFLWLDLIEIFGFKVGHFFRRDGAADPRWLGVRGRSPRRGELEGGSAPFEPEKFFAFWTSAEALSGNRRAKMGPLWAPKISPIGLELIFFGWI